MKITMIYYVAECYHLQNLYLQNKTKLTIIFCVCEICNVIN